MQYQVPRTQTDRIPRILRTTRPPRHLHDRAEPLLSIECSMATPMQLQGERSPTCAASHEHPGACTHTCSLTLAMRYAVAAVGQTDLCRDLSHAAR